MLDALQMYDKPSLPFKPGRNNSSKFSTETENLYIHSRGVLNSAEVLYILKSDVNKDCGIWSAGL